MNASRLLWSFVALTGFAEQPETPLFRLVDVNQGEPTNVALPNGMTARVQLLERSGAKRASSRLSPSGRFSSSSARCGSTAGTTDSR